MEVVNTILYVLKNGELWRDLPGEFPPWGTVYWYFSKWQASGVLEELNACLVVDCRINAQKKRSPHASSSTRKRVKNAATATGPTVGFDAGKLVKGRKCLVLIDTLGNVLASWVIPAGMSDAAAAIACWDTVAAQPPLLGQVQLVVGDSSFAGLFADHLRQHHGLRFEKSTHMVLRKKNFCIHKKRWLVERTLAWLSANRRLSKEYDRLLKRANAWLTWANIRRILKFC